MAAQTVLVTNGSGEKKAHNDNHPLAPLKEYKYQSVDKSLVSNYILRHYWNWAVELLPKWMAPNLVTLIGFGAILFNVLCLVIFMPDLVGPGHPILYFSFAFGLWM
ncbi:hypothetical protein TWF718_008108 [Orbilia javanica]|uniref:Uncharacterized protein n=1 Tax=Orbilia javanica TaxID=47235 RepID=A0AAN8RCV0_9PEZI